MCLLAMDGLHEVMPQKLLNDASESKIKGAHIALKNVLNSEVNLAIMTLSTICQRPNY